jgi:hypothetical protein
VSCCEDTRPCGTVEERLGLVPPPPGQTVLRRRVGEFDAFARDLVAAIERTSVPGGTLGHDWDVEGDPLGSTLVDLWAYVAEIVAAYAELTAGEAYLGTASDWTDLRRLADLVGYRPRPCVAAQGWVRAEVDKGADPLLPAGTRVQAPATATRRAQTFEVADDTQLYSDWNALTATWVPVAQKVEGRSVRFLGNPGFHVGDQVLFVREDLPIGLCVPPDWGSDWTAEFWAQYWRWILCLIGITPTAQPLALSGVVSLSSELGTTVVEFDRELGGVLSSETEAYAAYRVLASAGMARRLTKVVTVSGTTVSTVSVTGEYTQSPLAETSIVLDASLESLSTGQLVAIVAWQDDACDIVSVQAHKPISWEVAPGTSTRASKLEFGASVPTLLDAMVDAATATESALQVYVVDRRVVARHYEFPGEAQGATRTQLRLYPAPKVDPDRIAVETTIADTLTWEVLACTRSDTQETEIGVTPDAASGLIVDLVDGPPAGALAKARASANIARIRHGSTARAALGSGDATTPNQRFVLPDAPIAYDLDAAGTPVPTQVLRVEGVSWAEVGSLYGEGTAEVYAVRLAPDGGLTVEFGDGVQGARLPTGRNIVTTSYRVGGGTAGELESGAIDSLLGSVRGVKKVEGAGPTSGGSDQDDEGRLRRLVPTRARAFGRAVSVEDLVDLSLGYPGVTHAAGWYGGGPSGCACGSAGLHLAFVRAGTAGPRAPDASEVASLASFLDARRDATVPLCVCAAVLTTPLQLTVELSVDPRRLVADVVAAAKAAVADPVGPLGPLQRALGQPLDRSDVFAVLHAVTGVVGVPTLDVPGATGELGRRPAERYELIVLSPAPVIGGASA